MAKIERRDPSRDADGYNRMRSNAIQDMASAANGGGSVTNSKPAKDAGAPIKKILSDMDKFKTQVTPGDWKSKDCIDGKMP